MSGSLSRSITVLSTSVSSPDGDEFDLLAVIAREVVDQAPEAAEQLADRQHAHAHRGVAQLQRQPLDLLGDRLHRGVVAGSGDLPSGAIAR